MIKLGLQILVAAHQFHLVLTCAASSTSSKNNKSTIIRSVTGKCLICIGFILITFTSFFGVGVTVGFAIALTVLLLTGCALYMRKLGEDE